MQVSLLFIVLATVFVAENVNADKLNLAPILQLGLRFLLINLKQYESITLTDDFTFTIPEDWKNISTGSINLKNAQVYGFQTLDIQEINANDEDPSNENYIINLCVNLLFGQLGFSSNYDADAGIIDEIPIYGDGKINLAATEIIFDLCLNLNITTDFSQISVDDVSLSLELHDSPSYITRFWKNDNVSDIVTAIINILQKIIFMLLDYEKDCVSSLISPVIQYALNSILPNDIDSELVINSTCLQDSFGKEIDFDGMLQKLVTSYNEGGVTNLLSNTNVEQAKETIEKIEMKVLEIMRNEGFSIEA